MCTPSSRLPPGVVERRLGERARQAELGDHGGRVHAHVAGLAQHLDDDSLAVPQRCREPHHLHDDLVVLPQSFGAGIADRHRPGEAGAIDLHPALARGLEVGADEPRGPPLDDLHDFTSRPGAADVAGPQQLHTDRVAGGGVEGGGGRDVDVLRPVARRSVERPHEPVAAGGPLEDADHAVVAAAARGGAGPWAVVSVALSRHEEAPAGGGRSSTRRSSLSPLLAGTQVVATTDRSLAGMMTRV